MKTYRFYSDPGHGWVAVKRKELISLQVLHYLSSCSYQKGQTVYLEEDIDAGIFINAYENKYGTKPKMKTVYHDYSRIRNYESLNVLLRGDTK